MVGVGGFIQVGCTQIIGVGALQVVEATAYHGRSLLASGYFFGTFITGGWGYVFILGVYAAIRSAGFIAIVGTHVHVGLLLGRFIHVARSLFRDRLLPFACFLGR